MPDLDLSELRNYLLRSGVAPRHVLRTVAELNDHYEDLVDSATVAGADMKEAHIRARDDLGDLRDVARAVCAQPELRSWVHRFPYVALIVYPLTCLALLPATPVMFGIAHAADLAKWVLCIFLGGLVTAAMILFLQLSITLT